jgi:hypothetical protein
MLSRATAFLSGVLLVGLLAACAMVDVVDPRYDSINRSTVKARNESILLNIIRASHNAPLNFVAFSRVSGTTTMVGSSGLPQVNVGPFFPTNVAGSSSLISPPSPQRAFGLTKDTLGGTMTAQNNFDISLFETKEFYAGLLRPVDLIILNYFIRQGYSRELLFWLFAESVRQTTMGMTIEFLNDLNPNLACQTLLGRQICFKDMIDVAVASGLTVETKVEEKPASADGSEDGGAAGGRAGGKTGAKSGGQKTGSKSKAGGSGTRSTRTLARLCFDPVLAVRARKEYGPEILTHLLTQSIANHHPRCKLDPWETGEGTDTLIFNFAGTPYGTVKYEIIPRSTFGIYQFLGKILAQQQEDYLTIRGTLYSTEDRRILAVDRHGMGGCLVDINFEEEYYCVPMHGAENTKRILGLLAQLLALNTDISDLAITPTARIVGF